MHLFSKNVPKLNQIPITFYGHFHKYYSKRSPALFCTYRILSISTTLVGICKFANHTMLQNLYQVLDRLDAPKDRLRAAVDSIQYLNFSWAFNLKFTILITIQNKS